MATPFLGQISIYTFGFAPKGFAMTNGQLMSIQQNAALFSLLGTFYGGNGTTTFLLPDLQSRLPVHQGQGPGLSSYTIGQVAGTTSVTLIQSTVPAHAHTVTAATSTTTTTSSSISNG